jgi:alpha-tubulin suppressor-like RCC1 family protein
VLPDDLGNASTIVAVAGGVAHSLMLASNGAVYSFGFGIFG